MKSGKRIGISLFFVCLSGLAADFGSDDFVKSRFPIPNAIRSVTHMQKGDAFRSGKMILPADLRCEDQNVHAATPGQYTKKYHVDAILYYDQLKVPGTREVGLDPSVANLPGNMILQGSLCNLVQGGSNLNPATGDRWCLQAKVGRYTMMSDLFFCKVGEDIRFLRGYWESASIYKGFNRNNPMQTFRMENEHVMTMSMGRADTNKPDSDGNLIFVPGHTFPMEKKRFLFFTLATEQEILEIDKIIANQAGTYVRCPDGHFDVKRDGACSK